MNVGEERLCADHDIAALIASMARELADGRRPGVPLCLIGIRSRGVPLAQRLAQELRRLIAENVAVGAVDITLYRDDLGRSER